MHSFILDPPGPYLADHANPRGPDDARPTALKIIRDQNLDGTLQGKAFLITGCTAGIGIETARAIHATGADVYITGRNDTLGAEVASRLAADGGPGKVTYVHLELDSLASVRAGAAEVLKLSGGKLNVLICNAGVMMTPEGVTKDGFETQFGTNHLGHFALFLAVRAALLASSTPAFNSRVITLSSAGHQVTGIQFGNYDLKKPFEIVSTVNIESDKIKPGSPYDPMVAYGQSKTANIYMGNEIDRRYGSQGLHGLSVHPGGIATGLGKHIPDAVVEAIFASPQMQKKAKSVAQGAATTVWAAVGKEWEGKGGRYLENCRESGEWYPQDGVLQEGFKPWAYDAASEGRLWRESLAMVGEEDDAA